MPDHFASFAASRPVANVGEKRFETWNRRGPALAPGSLIHQVRIGNYPRRSSRGSHHRKIARYLFPF